MATGSVYKSSDLVMDYCCDACKEKHMEVSSEFFCKTCKKLFCGKCINLHSQLYEKHVSIGRGEMNQWPLSKTTKDFLQICEIHKEEKLKMFCQDHGQLCCTNCVLLSHRQCKEVTLLSKTGKSLSTDLQQLAVKIGAILKELKQLQSSREYSIKSVEDSFSEQLQEVRDVRQKLNAALDELEKVTMKELEDMRTALQASLKIDVDNCNRLKDELKQLSEAVHDLADKSMEELSFIAGRKCLDKIQESETYLKKNSVNMECSIIFESKDDIEKHLLKHLGLGRVVEGSQSLAFKLNPDKVITWKGKSEHVVLISSDSSQTCKITGICSLPSGQIVIADQENKRVKLLDKQYNVVSHCTLSGFLWDICHIKCNEVAVSVQDGQTSSVQFISVCNGQLVNNRKFQLQHNILGIAHHQGALYITSRTALYHYTLTGQLVKKIYEDTSGGSNTVWKCAVSPTGDRIYVINNTHGKLLTLSSDGTLLSSFTDTKLNFPWCVCVTPAGQVLVSWYSSNTITQMDREGRRKLATLATETHVEGCPLSVSYNINRNVIIVGMNWNTKILVLEVQ
ncbi:tripartite motif-containing protein 45-like [Dreissena polymorpha]|uniref:tripartite motif-containing protein 45-like n=1 Tax=Dreissena polymorpha TaxID=45954 RepID=UPI0022640D83|nr:tripartite motif-containing protein 45-like [Dreissena polymorpha]